MTAREWEPTAIDGVVRRRALPVGDARGSFSELWRASATGPLASDSFVQANLSRSHRGVLRGMHFHRLQIDLWILVEGRALVATTDLHGILSGATSAASQVLELSAGDAIFIPRIVAHGFWALEDLSLLYLVSHEYDGTDEYGFAWNDAAAAIDWPAGKPILSARDQGNPTLGDVAASFSHEGLDG